MTEIKEMKTTYTKKGQETIHPSGIKTIHTRDAAQSHMDHLLWLKVQLNEQIKDQQTVISAIDAAALTS